MDEVPPDHLSVLLNEARAGGPEAKDRLVRAIYDELRRLAGRLMRRERPGHTLQPSALVNEALMRLFNCDTLARATDRRYLFGAAAKAMRDVLIDHARRHRRTLAGSGRKRVPLDHILAYFEEQNLDVVALNDAIDRLAGMNERQGLVVALRFFAGLSIAEVAEALDVSTSTVEGDLRSARAWLRGELGGAIP
jgi:RNA polymerase sigma factor (TIGR02999 family)